ncbi:hypothetical protein A0H81_05444 [Grifola frondosa]|uniref:Mixed lineage kinase domain-containing protein n=1 Tax=Grifola frondosa TaxID=5627 RepID=A0A1C7MCS1_GRIFR|nr:hypothetical protein A0H81_05444 [Grifola frondosa]
MPLRYIRSKVSGEDALNTVIATRAVIKEIADLLQFTPAKAAASILLMVFETIQSMQSNRSDCYRLASRCLSFLVDLKDAMEGNRETAPESLIKTLARFEKTLESIHRYMKTEAEHKWTRRLLRKRSIEDKLAEYNAALDDAIKSFQLATLINIHLELGSRSTPSRPKLTMSAENTTPLSGDVKTLVKQSSRIFLEDTRRTIGVPVPSSSPAPTFTVTHLLSSVEQDAAASEDGFKPIEDLISMMRSIHFASTASIIPVDTDVGTLVHRGFRRHNQSEFIIRSRSRAKAGWWADTLEGHLAGQKLLMKRYEGERDQATRNWVRDIKILQKLYHPNLPQMVGYSNDETPIPFILLANAQTRLPKVLILDSLQNLSLAKCARLLTSFYRATLHANYRIDAEQTLVMGLPPPDVDQWISYRSFGLAQSIQDLYLKMLPNDGKAKQPHEPEDLTGSVEMQRKINHLALLAHVLLPNSADLTLVSARLQSILGDDGENVDYYQTTKPVTLCQIRRAACDAYTQEHVWSQSAVPAHKYAVGDLGYVPRGCEFAEFTVLCNVLHDDYAEFNVAEDATGSNLVWDRMSGRRDELRSSVLPGGIRRWNIVVPPGTHHTKIVHESFVPTAYESWRFLLDHGKDLAMVHGVEPQDLILGTFLDLITATTVLNASPLFTVTRVGIDLRFRLQDFRQKHLPPFYQNPCYHPIIPRPPFQHPGVPFRPHVPFGRTRYQKHLPSTGPELQPSTLYLFTAMDKEHEPLWSEQPLYEPPPKGMEHPPLKPGCFTALPWTSGFLNYVQLHAEDFTD